MSVCTGVGNGLGGLLGKWGTGLGSALGLGAVVDFGVRTYTGYGLFETLSVPYIECPDGTFSSAIEWYSSGLKCPKKPKPPEPGGNFGGSKFQIKKALGYASLIEALGGAVFPYLGGYAVALVGDTTTDILPGHFQPKREQTDEIGNTINVGYIQEGNGQGDVAGYGTEGAFNFANYGWGGWGSMLAPAGYTFQDIRDNPYHAETFSSLMTVWSIIGLRTSIPSDLPEAPPSGPFLREPQFRPPDRPKKKDCEEMSCPCVTPLDIENAVKKALGLRPFAPEKLIREMGAKMFVAPGPSLVPITPITLVDAIAALVAANYMRAGYARYPVLMPQSLINDDSVGDAVPAQPLENFAEWFEWMIKQQDAIQGEWPIDIAIVDGAKRQPLKFENISEAFAELTGLMIQTSTDADAAVAVGSHAAVAATKAQTAAIIAQKNAECLIRFFGVRTGYGTIFVESTITPMDSDNPTFNLRNFLKPSRQTVMFLTDNDPFDFQAVLDRVLRNTEIAKSAVALDAKLGLVGDYARNQRKYDTAEAKKEAEKELEKLEASIKANNPDFKVKIKVDTAAPTGDVSGNNFVIKRPTK